MSRFREPIMVKCPMLDECLAQIDEPYFVSTCRGDYEKCQAYAQMQTIPRAWERRLEQKEMDLAFSSTRMRGRK